MVYIGSIDGNVYAFRLKRSSEQPGPPSKRPDLKMLHPDFNSKVSQPVATRRGVSDN